MLLILADADQASASLCITKIHPEDLRSLLGPDAVQLSSRRQQALRGLAFALRLGHAESANSELQAVERA